MGDGGIVTTNDDALADKLRKLRVHGGEKRYYHQMVGGNFRLDTLQAAILTIKLPLLNEQHEGRIKNAHRYDSELKGVTPPKIKEGYYSIYNQYTIKSKNRDTLKAHLDESEIGNAIYYPIPLHLQECFSELGYKEGDLPNAEAAAKEVLSIPVFAELTDEQQTDVLNAINAS